MVQLEFKLLLYTRQTFAQGNCISEEIWNKCIVRYFEFKGNFHDLFANLNLGVLINCQYFQHDGAPSHHNFLPRQWIDNNCCINLPPHSLKKIIRRIVQNVRKTTIGKVQYFIRNNEEFLPI